MSDSAWRKLPKFSNSMSAGSSADLMARGGHPGIQGGMGVLSGSSFTTPPAACPWGVESPPAAAASTAADVTREGSFRGLSGAGGAPGNAVGGLPGTRGTAGGLPRAGGSLERFRA